MQDKLPAFFRRRRLSCARLLRCIKMIWWGRSCGGGGSNDTQVQGQSQRKGIGFNRESWKCSGITAGITAVAMISPSEFSFSGYLSYFPTYTYHKSIIWYGTLTKLTAHQRSGKISATTALSHQTYYCRDELKKVNA